MKYIANLRIIFHNTKNITFFTNLNRMEHIRKKIKDLIDNGDFSVKELSVKINKSPRTIYNYIEGKTIIDVETLVGIARIYKKSVSYFFGEENMECLSYKKGYYLLRKYRDLIGLSNETYHHQHIFEFFTQQLIDDEKFKVLQDFKMYESPLWEGFYKELYSIYEVQELFIKGYYTEKTDGDTLDFQRWLQYESKIKIKGKKDAHYKYLPSLTTIKILKGYEEYFSKQEM